MTSIMKKKNIIYIVLGGIIGVCLFLLIYGIRILDVTYDTWLMNGEDLNQHYIGWTAFRASKWQFPFGMHNGLTYPSSISVLYTDSIPLFAIFFKVIRSFLPETFQYFGLFGLLCFILNGIASAWIVSKFHKNIVVVSLFTILFTASPIVLDRLYIHTALSAQFLLLFSYGIWVRRAEFKSIKKSAVCWSVLGVLCVLIQSYFLFIVGGIMCGFLLQDLLETKKWKKVFCVMAAFFLSVLSVTFLIGGFSGSPSLGTAGFGLFSANLNTLYNPMGYSRLLPDLPAGAGQYEGFSYMGLGGLLLALLAVIMGVVIILHKFVNHQGKKLWTSHKNALISWGITLIIFFLLALSNSVLIGDIQLLYIDMPAWMTDMTAVVRSSGRFIWCIFYFILIFSVYMLGRLKKKHLVTVITVLLLSIQAFDLSKKTAELHGDFTSGQQYASRYLFDERWGELPEHYKRVMLYPVLELSSEEVKGLYYEYANLFVSKGLKLNNFYFSRPFDDCKERSEKYIRRKLKTKSLNEDTLYILDPMTTAEFEKVEGIHLYMLDSQILATFKEENLPVYDSRLLYSENRTIELDMTDAVTASYYMKNGWYGYEDGCAYARDKAYMIMYTKQVKKAVLRIEYMPMEGEQPTLVYIDSQYIGTIQKTEENNAVVIGIPDEILAQDGLHEICLASPHLVRGQVKEDTEVGMAVKKVSYEMYE